MRSRPHGQDKAGRSFGIALSLLILSVGCIGSQTGSPLEFDVQLTEEAASGIAELGLEVPVTGRAFVIITRDGESEPREQTGIMGVPLWGKDVRNLRGGDRVVFSDGDPSIRGYLLDEIGDIPPGDYTVQAFLERLYHLPPSGRACPRDASQQRSPSKPVSIAGKRLQ